MKISTSKEIRQAYKAYQKSVASSLEDCYRTHSVFKEYAYNSCIAVMLNFNGKNPKIVGYNSQVFTFGFIFEKGGQSYFAWITPRRRLAMPID